jgi:hypothetical protein
MAKICATCGVCKDLTEYHRDRRVVKDGRTNTCKACCSKRKKNLNFPLTHNPKKCSRCKTVKVASCFGRDRQSSDGRKSACKSCNKRDSLEKKYGLSLEEYLALYEEQEGKCKICSEHRDILCVDHCHTKGSGTKEAVRGLLCKPCNLALGNLKDDPDRLRSAIQYLESYYG